MTSVREAHQVRRASRAHSLYVVPDRGHVSSLYFPFRSPAVGMIRRFIASHSAPDALREQFFSLLPGFFDAFFGRFLGFFEVLLALALAVFEVFLGFFDGFFGLFLRFFDAFFGLFDAVFGFLLGVVAGRRDFFGEGAAAGAVVTAAAASGEEGTTADRRNYGKDRAEPA